MKSAIALDNGLVRATNKANIWCRNLADLIAFSNSQDTFYQEGTVFIVKLTKYCDFSGITRKWALKKLKEVIDSILHNSFYVELPEGGIVGINYFTSVAIYPEQDEIHAELNPKVIPYISGFKESLLVGGSARGNFTLIPILSREAVTFSVYSYSLYGLIKSYSYLPSYKIAYEDLRDKLALPADKYKQYSEFRVKILQPVLACLANLDNIPITVEEIKIVNKVDSLVFIFTENKSYKELAKARKERQEEQKQLEDSFATSRFKVVN